MMVIPAYDKNIRNESQAVRLMHLNDLNTFYLPSDMSVEIYTKLYLAMMKSMQKKESRLAVMQRNINAKNLRAEVNETGAFYEGVLGGSDSFSIIIQCGMTAARDFLKKINHEGLPLFNPLHGEGGTEKKGGKTSGSGESKEVKWNPVAKQLFNAIMWVIIIIDAKPDTPIFGIREKVWKFKSYEPFPSQVKAVNTIIGKNIVGKILTEAIDELRHDNDIRDEMCDFDKLIDIIGNYKDKEGNPVVIESKF